MATARALDDLDREAVKFAEPPGGERLAYRSVEQHPAFAQQNDALAAGGQMMERVGGHHDRQATSATRLAKATDQFDQTLLPVQVQPRRRLVEQQQFGTLDHRAGKLHLLLLAARKIAVRPPRQMHDTQLLERFINAGHFRR